MVLTFSFAQTTQHSCNFCVALGKDIISKATSIDDAMKSCEFGFMDGAKTYRYSSELLFFLGLWITWDEPS